MTAHPASVLPSLVAAQTRPQGRNNSECLTHWCRDALAGRVTELCGDGATAVLTLACTLVLDVQQRGEPVAWITTSDSIFFLPDVVESGIDCAALVVVRVPDSPSISRAAAMLVHSGAFGLVVLDLGTHAQVSLPLQARLVRLAQQHDTVVVCLTEKREQCSSLGSLVSCRVVARRHATAPDLFACTLKVLKDKRHEPGWKYVEERCAPLGLR